MQPSLTYATISSPLPARPYILSITPSPTSPHLLLRHPSNEITIVDNQTLQSIDQLRNGHSGLITDLVGDSGALWSSGKDGAIVRWDERARRAADTIKAFIRKPLPVLSLTISERDHLVIGGTEVVSSESHILFYDTRNSRTPAYTHSSTHSDDITHLSLLPSTSTFLSTSSKLGHNAPLPDRLLLSASTDGLVALSNMKETDEDEAVLAEENWGQSIAQAGAWEHKGKTKVWARSDMDQVALWDTGKGAAEELELQNPNFHPIESFKFRKFHLPSTGINIPQTAAEERQSKNSITSDYLIDVVPSLGSSKDGAPIVAVGTNGGDIIIQHHSIDSYKPSAFLLSGPDTSSGIRGHKDVIRGIYHDLQNEAIYTGSEDGVISGWSLASLPERLIVGDPAIDDVDANEEMNNDDDDDDESEESEIESEEEEDDDDDDERMDVESDIREKGGRYGPIIGANTGTTRGRGKEGRKEKRREGRFDPY